MTAIADHLWQSTFFAGVVWLLTLALRKNHARVRHALWLAASCKFLIPFSALIALGGQGHWRTASATAPSNIAIVMDQISQPFTAPAMTATAPPAPSRLPELVLGVWACGFIGITTAWWIRWRRIRAAVRAGSPLHLDIPIRAVSSPTLLEPGIFGVFRPTLLLPEGVFDRLTPAQLQAVIAHELCHVRHRDNLIAAIHMFVETVFWFHPLVWWIEKRMVEERERACDEEVLREFGTPKVYAEGILNVCKLYVESPLTRVSGVSGANLKKRIEAIMSNRVGLRLNFARKVALATAGAAALTVPIVVGIMHAQSPAGAAAPKFEVASIKRDVSGEPAFFTCVPKCHLERMTLKALIIFAYRVHDFQVTGGPGWIDSERYNIDAKAEGPPASNQEYVTLQYRRLQTLLRDRFNLTIHRETKELPIYDLTVAKRGPKLQTPNCLQREPGDLTIAPGKYCGLIGGSMAGGRLQASSTTMENLARFLSSMLSRTVVDKTGITGEFDLQLTFTPQRLTAPSPDVGGPRPADGAATADLGPDIFTAMQEQLGLKLESAKGPVEILVIDHVERPSEN